MTGQLRTRVARLESRHVSPVGYASLVRRLNDADLDALHAILKRQVEREDRGERPDPGDTAAAARIEARYLRTATGRRSTRR
jgi:hypothetical protein